MQFLFVGLQAQNLSALKLVTSEGMNIIYARTQSVIFCLSVLRWAGTETPHLSGKKGTLIFQVDICSAGEWRVGTGDGGCSGVGNVGMNSYGMDQQTN